MLDGFMVAGYRSFGADPVRIGDLGQVNIFIGRNNSGKSNILRFIEPFATMMKGKDHPKDIFNGKDVYNRTSPKISSGLQLKKNGYQKVAYEELVSAFPKVMPTMFAKESIWVEFEVQGEEKIYQRKFKEIHESLKQLDDDALVAAIHKLNVGGNSREQRVQNIADRIYGRAHATANVVYIPEVRKIKAQLEGEYSGNTVISMMNDLQHPPEGPKRAERLQAWQKVNQFLRVLIGDDTASIEITTDNQILVTIAGKEMPFETLGFGIQEILILAVPLTIEKNTLFCIEEPESHIHPEIQKKFIQYIKTETDNQYFIATHSNAFFDIPGVNTYHCWLENGQTKVKLASKDGEKHQVLQDLGSRPSDLLQSNFVLWVEGPSDRTLIAHWINQKAPELVEGLHYSVMIYGGRLLSHLSYDDEEVTEFINLSKLNRNAAILIDSDRAKAGQRINPTKQRVKKAFEDSDCIAWVTAGRTIENYVDGKLLLKAVRKVHPKIGKSIFRWAQFTNIKNVVKKKSDVDKVKLAKQLVTQSLDYSANDLGAQVRRLIGEIWRANGMAQRKI
ncbi:ATP-dependent endonuclease [Planctomycetota bacterium]